MSEMSKMQKMNQPDAEDKARAKDTEESMLPEQGYWYNSTMNHISSMKSNVQSEIMDWFMKNPRKSPDAETQKGWNEKLSQVEDTKLRVKSYEGRFKQNFKDVTKIFESDMASPNSSLGRIMTDGNGTPIVGPKANGNTGFMNYAEMLSQVDNIPGMGGRGAVGSVPYVETKFSGTFSNYVSKALKEAVKSKHYAGQTSNEQVSKHVTYMQTITTSNNADEVWNAAGEVMNSLGSKELNDLRSSFWENILSTGGKRQDGSFGFDETISAYDQQSGRGTVQRKTYSFSPSTDYDKIAIIEKIMNGGRPENAREENVVKDMITEYGIHRIINEVPTYIESQFTTDKFKSSDSGYAGGANDGAPIEPWINMTMNGPTNTTTMSKLSTDIEPDAFNAMKRYEIAWDNTMRTLKDNKAFQSIKRMKGESDKDFMGRKDAFINVIRDNMGKKILGPGYEDAIKNSGTLVTLNKYTISPEMSYNSGFNMLRLEGQKYWPIGAKELSLIEPGKFKYSPFVIEATANYKGDKLFGSTNENITEVTAIVHEDDLKNFVFTKTEGGKPKQISYEKLLEDYEELANGLMHKIDDKSIEIGSKYTRASGNPYLKDKVPSLEQMVKDKEWYSIKLYVANDQIINQAAQSANKTVQRNVEGHNVALDEITQPK